MKSEVMTLTTTKFRVLPLAALISFGMFACSGDSNDNNSAGDLDAIFGEDRAITVGDVKETAEKNAEETMGSIGGLALGQLTLSTTTLDFDEVAIGTPTTKSVTLVNTGSGNLRIDSFALVEEDEDGQDDGDREFQPIGEETRAYFTALNEGKVIYIAPQSSIDLEFEWKPVNTTRDLGTLTIASNDPNDEEKLVELRTPALGPAISAESKISFARVAAGDVDKRLTFIQNSGQSPLQLKDIVLSPASSSDFSFTFPDPSDDSDESKDKMEWKPTLEPGESIPMRIFFTPDSDEPANANIIISSNDQDTDRFEISLEGNAGTACIKLGGVNPATDNSSGVTHNLDFGESQIGRANEKTITITNCSRTQELNVSDISIVDDGGEVYEIVEDSLPEGVGTAEGAVIQPTENASFKVSYTPEGEETNEGVVSISSNDEVNRELTVGLNGKGTNNVCPVAVAEASIVGSSGRLSTMISTIPLKTIELTGENSRDPDGMVQRYEWNIVSKPQDSTARLTPNNRVSNPKLFLDLAGDYEIELTVYDAVGQASCEPSKVIIQAEPDEDIHVQLVWDTPGDADQNDDFGTDIDLHYLHPLGRWDLAPYDIYWNNKTGDWGVPGNTDDDPSLDIDDTNGAGPENVNHDNPESGKTYAVGVYYYNDNGFGVSYATVRIYIEGQVKFELRDKYMQKEDVFWDVAAIVWPSKQIFAKDRIYQGFPL